MRTTDGQVRKLMEEMSKHGRVGLAAKHYQRLNTQDQRRAMEQNLVFENLPSPEAEPVFTFSAQSAGSGKDEGRDPPVSRTKSRPSESGRQDLNLRPLGPEPAVGFLDGVGPERKGSDGTDIHGGPGVPRPPGAAPYEAGHAPDRAPVGRAGDRLVLPERLLTVREVAARLGVCRATVYAMVERGELRCLRVSNVVRVHPADLAALLVRERR